MSHLISQTELKNILETLEVWEYYVDVDMNGAISLALPPAFAEQEEKIFCAVAETDRNRTPDDIYEWNEILHPFKRIVIDDDDDEETLERFEKQDISYADYSQQLNAWLHAAKEEKKDDEKPKCVAFYSYKGGVGRSTALAVVARLLAKEGFKVAVLDLDLEAPGLNSLLLTKPKPSPFGVVDYLYHAPWVRETIDKERFLSQYIVREEVKRRNATPGQLYVMSAGGTVVHQESHQLNLFFDEEQVGMKLDSHYLTKLSYIDFDVYARQEFHVFQQLLDDLGRYTSADIILLDARTGVSDISGTIVNTFSDVISVHVQGNRQNREGIEFITNNIDKRKLKNMLWSHTKMPKGSKNESKDLENYIMMKVREKDEMIESPHFHQLRYDNGLDDINAHQLKEYIEDERVALADYKDLAEKITLLTGLDESRMSYIHDADRERIIADFGRLAASEEKITPYISQRFLNEDLEKFVGFPGSGKKTFSKYMREQHGKRVDVVSFEDFEKNENSAHRILSHMIFLDWNYEEATQAVCKWFLHSDVFFEWLINNERFLEQVDKEELKKMRDESQYELSNQVAEMILSFIFPKEIFFVWELLFNRLKYRDNHALPKDVMRGMHLYIQFYVHSQYKENFLSELKGAKALLPVPYGILGGVWKEIGEQKKQWLQHFDQNLYQLVMEYLKITRKEGSNRVYDMEYPLDEMLKFLQKTFEDDQMFKKTMKKALDLDIFKIDNLFEEKKYLFLSPVYQLIPKD